MKVRFAPRALKRARHIKTWLQEANRPSAEAIFDQELDRLTGKFGSMSPRSPVGVIHEARQGKTVWRVRLPRSQQHVFYSIDERNDTVVIRTIWGARRGRSPKL